MLHHATPPLMTEPPEGPRLGAMLKARRRAKRMTLRDLADEIDVSFNTLSRVERGHLPDLKNFRRIVDWLEVPAEMFLESVDQELSTPEIIARHLRSDARLTREAASQIAKLVEDMYHSVLRGQPRVAVHLRSAKTFTPAAGALLAEVLTEMQRELLTTSE
ncbi:MAG: helix-turn-helix domain-containing protein [Actinomycetota bacterium]|nr:helix-turn-helix domain-containing protein [Actinomycetota bacterium]